jgi:hypothetical protein
MRAFGAVGNAAGFDDMAEQAEIGKIETHRARILRITRNQVSNIADCTAKNEYYFRRMRKLGDFARFSAPVSTRVAAAA